MMNSQSLPWLSFLLPLLPILQFLILMPQLPRGSSNPDYYPDEVYYQSCGDVFSCGDIRDVGYPFRSDNDLPYCGYPGFELSCNGENTTIDIMNETYRVLEINQASKTMKIVREDFMEGNYCPQEAVNTSLDNSLFEYTTTHINLTFLYGCHEGINNTPGIGTIPCGDSNDAYVLPAGTGVSVNCSSSMIVPVPVPVVGAGYGGVIDSTLLMKTLKEGQEIRWKMDSKACDDCTKSKGRCGLSLFTNQTTCYCPSPPYVSETCSVSIPTASPAPPGNSSSSSSNKRPMGIGLGIAGAVLAGVGIGWLIFRQKRRRVAAQALEHDVQVLPAETKNKGLPTPPSSNSLSSDPSPRFMRSIPSYPSSGSVNLFGRDSYYFGAQIFTYAELEEATNNFDQSRELGDGGFGTVFYGKLPDGRVVAVKRLYENNFKRVEQFMNEVEILTKLRHENLVVLYGCTSKQSRDLLLVYEYIPNGTVADHLHGKRAKSGLLSWPIRMKIAIETADALAFLHKSEIIHRDVKTNNILLDNDFHVKVADFGLSRLFPTDVTHVSTAPQGTPGYVDPEYYQVYQLTERSDVYSFGVVLIELISSLQAVDTNRHRHDINLSNMAINKIQNHALHELVDPSLGFVTNSSARRMITLVAELAFRCLQQVRDMRPSMQEVLDTLRRIENEELNGEKVEVLDIVVDDVALLKGNATSSPDSSVTDDKGASSSRPNSIG
ncbi:PREDICTED: LEAF RUST 10 DISEASE-RESISTANCE LOCUS RECEPTOR-LIKE PROTEIN KINASE-like 1.3 isoform X2 [Ipomoea nil]|uniref:LEAF RUST 10 DISEASE-RESISTANCE LOCUS RECEPTOR-LIKE PROTEIN KINASE-like 1.3 isoform X2 n=1 Tax=Ipomoea nil TaxID=35883 RepID=UPI000901C0A1|nr:PREDICTED: LEAF RUST 10 DISEASE-RESISTANCE LOCUS RECEPTOR-LIKE PROTEIN KINASE-like 1.3 isoform X2 [Ipomoea nil]